MIHFTQGNLLDADVEALVNTVNTVGIMGKGIALMFKEAFPENFNLYAAACKRREVQVGKMFVTESPSLQGPRWIINFPTKQHWRGDSKIEWVAEGLKDLRRQITDKQIRSIAIPPLGSGNGGLDWETVRPMIKAAFVDFPDIDVHVYEPTRRYQNVAKNVGVETLTPARALVAEMVRRYSILGLDCSILEVQKLAYFLERVVQRMNLKNPLQLSFSANKYGPYSHDLTHLLNALDGSYLHCEKRLTDASPLDTIRFDDARREMISAFFATTEGTGFEEVADATERLIDSFQSPLGMEALATVDWLLARETAEPTLEGVKRSLAKWPGGEAAAERKKALFSDKLLQAALDRLRV